MACNCKNTNELRLVAGNPFGIRLTVVAQRVDGSVIEDFDLGAADAVLKVLYVDGKKTSEFTVEGNDAIVEFGGDLHLGWYGLEMTGVYNDRPWRWCVMKVFQIVETNAKANIPAWAVMTDATYLMSVGMTLASSGPQVQSDWNETNPESPAYIINKPNLGIYATKTQLTQTEQQLQHKIDLEEARAKGAEIALQGNIDAEELARQQADTTLQWNIDAEEVRAKAAEKQNAEDIDAIEEKIPQQASSQNQLADKNFVNSSVSTNTAYYISNNGAPFTSLAQLEAYSGPLTNNDYAFVVGTDQAGNTTYTRYKYNADTEQWAEEYVLNNSSFTADQWESISSGITSGDVEKLAALPTKTQLDLLLAGKQDVINDLANIRSGAQAGATAVQPASIADMEVKSNKVIAINDQSTNTQYPSAKAVYDFVGGALSKYVEHGTDDTTFMLTPNCFHIWGEVASLTLTLPSLLLPGYEFVFQFTSGATATALSLPSNIKWFTPHTVKDRMLYQVRILNGCASMQGVDISLAGDPYVDLGLPSGVKWAKRNIDVTRDSGFTSSDYEYNCSFFSWGNIDGHNPTSSSSFSPWDWGGVNGSEPWYEGQVYGSTPGNTLTGNIPVGAEYDAARAILGSPWRMPTSSEYQELFNNTDFLDANGDVIPASTTNKLVTIEGIVGIRFASKINGNELFFPCSGYGNGTSIDNRGSYGLYWSSTWNSARYARRLFFGSGGVFPQNDGTRCNGFAVRAVQ